MVLIKLIIQTLLGFITNGISGLFSALWRVFIYPVRLWVGPVLIVLSVLAYGFWWVNGELITSLQAVDALNAKNAIELQSLRADTAALVSEIEFIYANISDREKQELAYASELVGLSDDELQSQLDRLLIGDSTLTSAFLDDLRRGSQAGIIKPGAGAAAYGRQGGPASNYPTKGQYYKEATKNGRDRNEPYPPQSGPLAGWNAVTNRPYDEAYPADDSPD